MKNLAIRYWQLCSTLTVLTILRSYICTSMALVEMLVLYSLTHAYDDFIYCTFVFSIMLIWTDSAGTFCSPFYSLLQVWLFMTQCKAWKVLLLPTVWAMPIIWQDFFLLLEKRYYSILIRKHVAECILKDIIRQPSFQIQYFKQF